MQPPKAHAHIATVDAKEFIAPRERPRWHHAQEEGAAPTLVEVEPEAAQGRGAMMAYRMCIVR
jgi:hypothetical protein